MKKNTTGKIRDVGRKVRVNKVWLKIKKLKHRKSGPSTSMNVGQGTPCKLWGLKRCGKCFSTGGLPLLGRKHVHLCRPKQPFSSILCHLVHQNVYYSALLVTNHAPNVSKDLIRVQCSPLPLSLVPIFLHSIQNSSVNWINRLLSSLLCLLKIILWRGGHFI